MRGMRGRTRFLETTVLFTAGTRQVFVEWMTEWMNGNKRNTLLFLTLHHCLLSSDAPTHRHVFAGTGWSVRATAQASLSSGDSDSWSSRHQVKSYLHSKLIFKHVQSFPPKIIQMATVGPYLLPSPFFRPLSKSDPAGIFQKLTPSQVLGRFMWDSS